MGMESNDKKMTIIPQPNIVYLKVDRPVLAGMDTSSIKAAVEFAEVIAFTPIEVTDLKVGDKVFVKAWAMDTVTYNNEEFHFVNLASGGILAVVQDNEPKTTLV